jgi:hypothetical protein
MKGGGGHLGLGDLNVINKQSKQGVCHSVALPFTLKSILRQEKNYGNSNILPCKKYNLQKILQKKPKLFKIL